MALNPKKNNNKSKKAIWYRLPSFLLINFVIATILMIFFCPSCFLSIEGLNDLFPEYLFSFFISMVLSYGGSRVEDLIDQRISWVDRPFQRLLLTVSLYMAYAFVASFLVIFLYAWIDGQFTADNIPWKNIAVYTKMPMTVALIFMAIFTTWSWLGEWRKSALEAEILRNEKLASQYQSLKDQLNPHFLFNSLNLLSNLVYEDADKSAEFIQKLSRIYRYVLEAQKEEVIELEREVDFATNYLELQKIRFEESLQFSVDIKVKTGMIPPLSLQLLLENAIKHNIISEEKPLFIHIFKKKDDLWISNTFQPRSSQNEPSTGVGLQNIKMRYQLLSDREIDVIQTEDEFLVKLPILELST
ncbi:histidine kinase [Algoriphagus sp. AGSA1]|uniref:sensor histidine kinase n=1 Tax=Algoriphagus sp. AGSA1 TaxID=2907213 RepID=UPI001F20B6AC|nr:histidine kinase [Algoriphagus sp. AGSA1]MCE7055431.1 histidine kinase [Algoriphagus sp. AGSA1]